MKKHAKKWLMLSIGLVITVFALWFSTRQVVWSAFFGQLKNFKLIWLIPSAIFFYYSMYLRAVRWGLLFRPHHHLKGYQVFRPLMLCFGFNSLLPGRVGEFARAWVVGTRQKTGVTTALATVVAERILDAATLMGMLAVSLTILPPVNPTLTVDVFGKAYSGADFNSAKNKIVLASIVLVVGVIVFMIPLTQRVMHGVIQRLPWTPHRIKSKLRHLLVHFAQGFHALQQPWVMAQILFHSIVLWLMIGVSNQFLARGFGLPMSLAQAEAQMVIVAIFITLPATPGYWGLFEAGMIFSSLVLAITTDQSLALAYALVVHLMQYVPIVVMGLIFAWQLHMRPADMAEITQTEPEPEQSEKK